MVAVPDGADALRQIDQLTPALVVLDFILPRVDGRDVNRELKARIETRDIPVLVVSGADVTEGDAKEFTCLIRKPCDPDRLLAAVDQCLRRARGTFFQLS